MSRMNLVISTIAITVIKRGETQERQTGQKVTQGMGSAPAK